MKRYDIEKRSGHSYGYADAGWKVTQADETILKLTRAEADIVVLGLTLIVQERDKLRSIGLKPESFLTTTVTRGEPVDEPQKACPENLLKAMSELHYFKEATITVAEEEAEPA